MADLLRSIPAKEWTIVSAGETEQVIASILIRDYSTQSDTSVFFTIQSALPVTEVSETPVSNVLRKSTGTEAVIIAAADNLYAYCDLACELTYSPNV